VDQLCQWCSQHAPYVIHIPGTNYPQASASELARRFDEFNGVFEGDDGIVQGHADLSIAKRLGLKLKFEQHNDFTTASFCGIIKLPDEDTIFTDPVKVLSDFFVLESSFGYQNLKQSKTRLRAKALSYYYQYSNCPVIGPLAFAVLQHTRGFAVTVSDVGDYYKRELLREALDANNTKPFYHSPPNVSDRARSFVEQEYGLSREWQEHFEIEIAKWSNNQPHCIWTSSCFDAYCTNAEKYLSSSPIQRPAIPREKELIPFEQRFRDSPIWRADIAQSARPRRIRRNVPQCHINLINDLNQYWSSRNQETTSGQQA
jgi:hypothetical protein